MRDDDGARESLCVCVCVCVRDVLEWCFVGTGVAGSVAVSRCRWALCDCPDGSEEGTRQEGAVVDAILRFGVAVFGL